MRILFVEDNRTFSDKIKPLIDKISLVRDVVAVRSRASALDALTSGFFDLIVLDLCIPLDDESLDAAPEYGQAVFHEARKMSPGTPIFILTGSEPDAFSRALAKFGDQQDLWGTNSPTATIAYYLKEEVDKLLEDVRATSEVIAETERIDIDTRGRDLNLSQEYRRIIKVVTRRIGAVSCVVQPMGGGLSNARVFRVTFKNDLGQVLAVAAAKVGSSAEIGKEHSAFESHVRLLKIGAFPHEMMVINQGVRQNAGIFYSLAEDARETLFEVIKSDIAAVPTIIADVRNGLDRWVQASTVRQVPIRDIRRRMIGDDDLAMIRFRFNLPAVDSLEKIIVRAKIGCIHGDLHCGNILVNPKRTPIIIDFGDVGSGYCCLDAITLELSMIFHPDSVRSGLSKILSDRIHLWPDTDSYLRGNPLGGVVEACRTWSHDVSGGDKDVLASAYAFAIRQLKYDTIEPNLIISLINSISERLLAD